MAADSDPEPLQLSYFDSNSESFISRRFVLMCIASRNPISGTL